MKFVVLFTAALVCFNVGAIEAQSTVTNCDKNSVFSVKNVKVTPDPPQIGKDMTLNADVEAADTVNGGTVSVRITGAINVAQTFDLCKISPVGCPILKGSKSLSFTQKIPPFIPSGNYNLELKAMDSDNKRELLCLNVNVTLKKRRQSLFRSVLLRHLKELID